MRIAPVIAFLLSLAVGVAQEKAVVVGLIGDSTVAEQSGWGPAFAERFDRRAKVVNYAKNGATLQALSKKLDELVQLKPDYVLIQFGHNDQKRYDTTVYRDHLRSYVERIRKLGGKAVIVSSVTRRSFDAHGKIVSNLVKNEKYNYQGTLTDYANAAKAVAKELNLPFIDLHRASIAHHNQIGREASMAYNFKEGDKTHFNRKGAEAITDLILEELKTTVPELAAYLKVAPSPHAQSEEFSVKVMTYNIYRGGEMRGQPLSQTAKVIQEAKADIVGVQETKSPRGVNAQKLAQLLGWNCHEDHWSCILTRFEIVERLKGDRRNPGGIKVRLPSGQEAYVFNRHLPSNPYQPYQLLGIRPKWHKHWDTPFIKTEAEAIAAAKKARGRDISLLLQRIRAHPDKKAPVFVVGDFNEPSHLDWTDRAAQSGRHPIKVKYPTSLRMANAGFADAWRTVHPDEMEKPGYTWTPAMKADDPKTHHDRIDFVYFRGKGVEVTDVKVVGENKTNADIVVAPWPSDHRAVVATFTLPNQPEAGRRNLSKPGAGDGK